MRIFKIAVIGIFFYAMPGCNPSTTPDPGKNQDTTTLKVTTPKPVYAYPVKYTEWEIGNPAFIKTVIDSYKAWDERDVSKLQGYFSDTFILRLPDEPEEIKIPNNKIDETLTANRGLYTSTTNNIISAISLHDRESNEDWVMITTYNKWTEKNGARDSILLHEDWLIKDGKIKLLMSYSKTPTKTFLKKNDPQAK